MDIELSTEQKEIIAKVISWYKNNGSKPILTLGGFAGTGKTTLIGFISKQLREKKPKLSIAFCSYTGKAVRVLETKLKALNSIFPTDSVSTIHHLIYEPELNEEGDVISWKRKENQDFEYGLIIVDESSMINRSIWDDICSYNVPILAVGDHGQLPPIEGSLNLMEKPDLKLETIFRQEEDNPVIFVSKMARTRGIIPAMDFGNGVMKLNRTNPDTQDFLHDLFLSYNEDMLILVGFNNTRVKINKAIRELLGFDSDKPQPKDRVICLRNSYEKRIYNGMMGRIKGIEEISDDWGTYYKSKINLDDEPEFPFEGLISYNQFGTKETLYNEKTKEVDLFDFGYALTVHKAQGSQAKTVVLFEERFPNMENDLWKRWLYTGITRSSEKLIIVG